MARLYYQYTLDLILYRLTMSAGSWTKWTDSVYDCMELIGIKVGSVFSLDDMYAAESVLQRIYPDNNHIQDKIRQQLQIMRESEVIEFIDNEGVYRRLK